MVSAKIRLRSLQPKMENAIESAKTRPGADVGNLISGSSAFPKSSLNIWKLMFHLLLKPGLENFEHYFPNM